MIKNANGHWVEDETQVRQLLIDPYRNLFALNDTRMKWEEMTY